LDQAIVHFGKALGLRPSYAQAHNNLGVALARQGRFHEAIVHFKKALQLRPDFVQASNNLGLALHDAGVGKEPTAGP
jgi:Flp pilus assembly protein TadD